jgi:hypothetical protein
VLLAAAAAAAAIAVARSCQVRAANAAFKDGAFSVVLLASLKFHFLCLLPHSPNRMSSSLPAADGAMPHASEAESLDATSASADAVSSLGSFEPARSHGLGHSTASDGTSALSAAAGARSTASLPSPAVAAPKNFGSVADVKITNPVGQPVRSGLNPLHNQDYLHAMQKQQVGALQLLMQQQQQQQQNAFMMQLQQQQQQQLQQQLQRPPFPYMPMPGNSPNIFMHQMQQHMPPSMGSFLPTGGVTQGSHSMQLPMALQHAQAMQQLHLSQKQMLAQKQQMQFLAAQKQQQAGISSQPSQALSPASFPSTSAPAETPASHQIMHPNVTHHQQFGGDVSLYSQQVKISQPSSAGSQSSITSPQAHRPQLQVSSASSSFVPAKASAFGATAFVKKSSTPVQPAAANKVATTSVYVHHPHILN